MASRSRRSSSSSSCGFFFLLLSLTLVIGLCETAAAAAAAAAAATEGAAANDERIVDVVDLQTTMQNWDHNFSCIFDNGRSFSYLHIGYVSYFNISAKSPTWCTLDECVDSCTSDCSCSALVYDVPRDSCYHYHDYIPVQSIPFIPVGPQDTVSAYLKVQRGGSHYSLAPPLHLSLHFFFFSLAALLAAAVVAAI